MSELHRTPGWPRAVLTAGIVVVVAVALLAFGPNLIVTRLTGMDRGQRVGLAVAWFFIALIGLSWILRRLQERGVL